MEKLRNSEAYYCCGPRVQEVNSSKNGRHGIKWYEITVETQPEMEFLEEGEFNYSV